MPINAFHDATIKIRNAVGVFCNIVEDSPDLLEICLQEKAVWESG